MRKGSLSLGETAGIVLGVIAIVVAALALTPEEWNHRLAEWRSYLSPTAVAGLTLFAGFSLGMLSSLATRRRLKRPSGPRLIRGSEYEAEVRRLITSGEYRTLKIFGYTGETVWADLVRFDDRYRQLEVQMLHRNWQVEARDEEEYNRSLNPSRPWAKSVEIQRFGTQSWEHALRRGIRYYSHHPIIKGMILYRSRGEGRIAFVTSYHWIERPAEGGSPFKGANMHMVMLDDDIPGAKPFIDYLESQFDYEWSRSPTAQQLATTQGPEPA